jgi:hypothetical protein
MQFYRRTRCGRLKSVAEMPGRARAFLTVGGERHMPSWRILPSLFRSRLALRVLE